MDFNKIEQSVISFWEEYHLHDKIKDQNKDLPKWEFLDGPPFVNGTPHHGHLLVSSIKDTMARYMSQKGYQISYQIGFDCHGLPLEQEAEKKVGKVSPNDSVEKLTVFNDECRSIISNCSEIWYNTLGRLGRQFDKSETYYTADFKFMESLWWAFNKLWSDGLIYRSKKVMPYSPKCETPLSNFEASSNYQDRTDISVYVKFKLVDSDEKLLIWTTTPWSLFANQGICVNPDLEYSLVELSTKDCKDKLWISKDLVEKFCVGEFSDYTVVKTITGKELANLSYEPIFKLDNYSNYKVYADNYVQNTTGTGLVHLAPLFGDDDMRVMKAHGYTDDLLPESIVDSQVKFTIDFDVNGTNIKNKFVIDTSTDIVIWLKNNKHALKSEKIKHQYPHCWRTDYPLIYLATDAWFMNVKKIIPELVENNKKIQWYPEYVGTERFANWIKDSPDWCLSRNRVWGTPIPIWVSETGKTICINSVAQLEELTGTKINDLHLDKITDLTFDFDGQTYKRTFGVLDCWFESGMAGLARYGFPECTNKSYPVDFIAESLDQTRGWFYTLNVLSTALNHQPAFKKVIVSGLILAADGKKMSKRLGNYTSPNELINKHGVDVFRLYMIGSPAAKAESFCFKDGDLVDISRRLLPYFNAHTLLSESLTSAEMNLGDLDWVGSVESTNKLDMWIKNQFNDFSNKIYSHMEKLELTACPNLIYKFIDELCNSYIKLSRERLKGLQSSNCCMESISTLMWVLEKFNLLLVPFMPHLSEHLNMSLHLMTKTDKSYQSIHLIKSDHSTNSFVDSSITKGFYSVNELLETVRNLRQQINKPIYYPLDTMEIYTNSLKLDEFATVICKELNVKNLTVKSTNELTKTYRANRGILGKIYKKDANKFAQLIESGNIDWDGCDPSYYSFDFNVESKPNYVGTKFNYMSWDNMLTQSVVYLSTESSESNDMEAEVNNIRRQVNNIRKDMGLKMFNKVNVIFENNIFWTKLKDEYPQLMDGLLKRLIADIYFEDQTIGNNYKLIETFVGNQLKVVINPQ